MFDTKKTRRYKLINKYLDWVKVQYEKINNRDSWYVYWTLKRIVSVIPEWANNLHTIYKMLRAYRKKYWDVFTIDKDDEFVNARPWGNRSKTKIYLLDKEGKLLMYIPSKTTVRHITWNWWDIDKLYSKLKKKHCPNLDRIVEEDFYWNQYDVLVK